MDIEQYFKYIGMAITAIGSLSGAVWAFRKWWVRDEHFPRVAFDLRVNIIDETDNQCVLEIVAILENKGVVPLKICNFTCEIRGILEGEKLEIGGESIRNQLNFKNQLRHGWFIPTNWKYSFVYPSIQTDYNFVTAIPSTTRYVLIKGEFEYYRRFMMFGNNRSHHAGVVLSIPGKLRPGDTAK